MSLGPIRGPAFRTSFSNHQNRKLHSNETDPFNPRPGPRRRPAHSRVRPNLGENIAVSGQHKIFRNDEVDEHDNDYRQLARGRDNHHLESGGKLERDGAETD